jgi:predicted nucleic acid-binding protein
MRVLVDTSAWIEFLRPSGEQNLKTQVADVLASGRAAFTCPVRFELYAGARKSETRTLDEALSFAHRIEVTTKHWDLAAGYAAELRSKGITVPASDLLIATVAVEQGVALIARDNHFLMIKEGVLTKLRLSLGAG